MNMLKCLNIYILYHNFFLWFITCMYVIIHYVLHVFWFWYLHRSQVTCILFSFHAHRSQVIFYYVLHVFWFWYLRTDHRLYLFCFHYLRIDHRLYFIMYSCILFSLPALRSQVLFLCFTYIWFVFWTLMGLGKKPLHLLSFSLNARRNV